MRELRLVLLGLFALISVYLGTAFLLRAFKGPPGSPALVEAPVAPEPPSAPAPPPNPAVAKLEQAITGVPDYQRYFTYLRGAFPVDYASVVGQVATAEEGGSPNLDKVMLDVQAEMRRRHGTAMGKASDATLARYFDLETRQVAALAERDPHLCVVFASGNRSAGFLGFFADHRSIVADAGIAALDAMRSGLTEAVGRAVPSNDDLQSLDHALVEAGLSRPEIIAILDDTPPTPPIADERMCKAQQLYMTTLAGLRPDVRSRLYAIWADLIGKS